MAAASVPQSIPAGRSQAEHERDLVESAISIIASAGASRVVVVLPDGDLLLPEAQSSARPRGVIVRASTRPDGGRDIVVEPAG